MLEGYFDAFEDYLRTGKSDALAEFAEAEANPAFLSVYRNGYLKTCTDALAASYPVVRSLVGEDYFRRLAQSYVENHPPTRGTLVGYGNRFAEFLQVRPDEHELAYLPDMVAIDAAWLESYFAGDASALTATDVRTMSADGIDVSTIKVRFTPPVRFVKLQYDVADTWAVLREQGTLSDSVSLNCSDNTVMLWRLEGKIHIKVLDPGESAFLSEIAGVATLESAATAAIRVDESFDLASTFAALLTNKILQQDNNKQ